MSKEQQLAIADKFQRPTIEE